MWKSALLEMRLLHRVVGWPMLAAALAFALVLRLQEPQLFLRQGLPFYWPSIQALVCALMLLLPWTWLVSRGVGAGPWFRRYVRQPLRTSLACWLGICLEGALLITAILAISITVKSIVGDEDLVVGSLGTIRAGVGVLCCAAALAPGLAMLGLSITGLTLLWMVLLATSLGIFGWGAPLPLDRLLLEPTLETEWTVMLPPLAATVAGLLLSWMLLSHRKN